MCQRFLCISTTTCCNYEFRLGNNASAAVHHLCAALSEGAVADRIGRDWFKRFCEDDTSLEDCLRSGRARESGIERIKTIHH